jgi:hypothetical protein
MSKAHVRHLGGSTIQSGIDDLVGVVPGIVAQSIEQYATILQRSSRLLTDLLPTRSLKLTDCCEIPEQACPPRCVCEIDWEACPGESLHATIGVRNTSSRAHDFTFSAGPWTGAAGELSQLNVSPQNAHLGPGERVVITLALQLTPYVKSGQQHEAEVTLRGAYEQCVRVRLQVCDNAPAHCEVEQGDPPVRVRAHQWYDHFQCEEPCGPARTDANRK